MSCRTEKEICEIQACQRRPLYYITKYNTLKADSKEKILICIRKERLSINIIWISCAQKNYKNVLSSDNPGIYVKV